MKKPINLDECLDQLEKMIDKDEFLKNNTVVYHHTAGRHIRNEWGLWDEKSELHKWFKSIGIWHADDMSGIIFDSLKRKLKGEDIKLDEQVENYKEFWKKSGIKKE